MLRLPAGAEIAVDAVDTWMDLAGDAAFCKPFPPPVAAPIAKAVANAATATAMARRICRAGAIAYPTRYPSFLRLETARSSSRVARRTSLAARL
jgi:hypothetical protein